MSVEQFAKFKHKIRQLNAFVEAIEADPALHARAVACANHHDIVCLATECGFDIAKRWGDVSADQDAQIQRHQPQGAQPQGAQTQQAEPQDNLSRGEPITPPPPSPHVQDAIEMTRPPNVEQLAESSAAAGN
jgi:hypothetical protein